MNLSINQENVPILRVLSPVPVKNLNHNVLQKLNTNNGALSPVGVDTIGEAFKLTVTKQPCHGGFYSGEVNTAGKKDGFGRKTWTVGPLNGSVYEGEWKDNIQNGHGTLHYANGGVCVGGWKNDREFGAGSMRYPNGDVYTGVWADNGDSDGQMRRVDGTVLTAKYRVMWYGAGVWSYEPLV
jgi:hypothetical protein